MVSGVEGLELVGEASGGPELFDLLKDVESVGPLTKTALVHAVREAVTNIRKHAGASHVDIRVERSPRELAIVVTDDGVGARSPEGLGLVTTRERLDTLGGTLAISSNHGTVFRASIPAETVDR